MKKSISQSAVTQFSAHFEIACKNNRINREDKAEIKRQVKKNTDELIRRSDCFDMDLDVDIPEFASNCKTL